LLPVHIHVAIVINDVAAGTVAVVIRRIPTVTTAKPRAETAPRRAAPPVGRWLRAPPVIGPAIGEVTEVGRPKAIAEDTVEPIEIAIVPHAAGPVIPMRVVIKAKAEAV